GRRVTASNVTAPTNSVAPRERTTSTTAPRRVSSRASRTDLYAAIPPVTPRTTRRPCHTSGLGAASTELAELQVTAGQLLHRKRGQLLHAFGLLEPGNRVGWKLIEIPCEPCSDEHAAVLRTGLAGDFLRGEDVHANAPFQ